jgi:hypothetical protein
VFETFYRLQSSLLPGASAATNPTPIILSKLTPTNQISKYECVTHFFAERAANQVSSFFRVSQKESFLQFSKTPTSKNFGDLPRGEIPEPLKVNRPFCK